jgi:hypothetical protein
MESKDKKLVVVTKKEILEQVSGARAGTAKGCESACDHGSRNDCK